MLIRRKSAALAAATATLMAGLMVMGSTAAFAGENCSLGLDGMLICVVSLTGNGGGQPVVAPPTGNDGSGQAPLGGSGDPPPTGHTGNDPVGNGGECAWRILNPAPPANDPRWAGHDPIAGSVLFNLCNGPIQYMFVANATPPPSPPPPNPAVLAQQAYAELTLPKPTLGRSPDLKSGDPARGGDAYTVVNLWTRYFSDPVTWVRTSKTVTLRGVSATVTATPVALNFDPGDGNAPVSCSGPGRPWQSSDAFNPPSAGECAYQYKRVEATPITGTESITWQVAWTGTGGAGGGFAPLVTSAGSQFIVEQIEVVSK
jgi:hypothetical protein